MSNTNLTVGLLDFDTFVYLNSRQLFAIFVACTEVYGYDRVRESIICRQIRFEHGQFLVFKRSKRNSSSDVDHVRRLR